MELLNNQDYRNFLASVKHKIITAQTHAVIRINQDLLLLYWEIGKELVFRQEKEGWGGQVTEQLSRDLKAAFPNLQGFSKRNLNYMKRFAKEYMDIDFLQVPLAKISWYHNITLLEKCDEAEERFWYAQQAIEYGWSRNMMVNQIELNLFKREGKAITNFQKTLPSPQSDMAQQTLKDPYIFDFLTLSKSAKEQDLELALMQHITQFLLELGAGFAFLGRQYVVKVEDEDFKIDLLFYHTKLRCYIVVDLKVGKFKPEYAGKMNFYLSVVDDQLKTSHDNPSIGIILCKNKKEVVVEYALKDISKPIGIAEYRLSDAIPEDLKSNLPTIEQLEAELKHLHKPE